MCQRELANRIDVHTILQLPTNFPTGKIGNFAHEGSYNEHIIGKCPTGIVWVFQEERSELLNFTSTYRSNHTCDDFPILFGLSMDYEVLMLRIHEWERTEIIRWHTGLQKSGRIITSAA